LSGLIFIGADETGVGFLAGGSGGALGVGR